MQTATPVEGSVDTYGFEFRAAKGVEAFGGAVVTWRIKTHVPRAMFRRVLNRECFDADKVGARVVLRHWRPGDRFQPSGMSRAVKLQDLFTNAKVPARARRLLLVAEAADGRIFWVEGMRIAESFKLTATTRVELRWRWRRLNLGA